MIHPVNSRLQRIAFPDNNTHAGSIQSTACGICSTGNGIAKPATDQTNFKAYTGKKRRNKKDAAPHLFVPAT